MLWMGEGGRKERERGEERRGDNRKEKGRMVGIEGGEMHDERKEEERKGR